MIFRYVQADTNPNIQQAIYGDIIIGTGHSYKMLHGDFFYEDKRYILDTNFDGQILFKKNNIVVGEVSEKLKVLKTGRFFSSGYSYFDFKINNRSFIVYNICFGKRNQIYYQIEENGKTVGMVQKASMSFNNKAEYTCYTEDSEMAEFLSLWCLFLQSSKYYPFMVSGEGNVIKTSMELSSKEKRKLFDNDYVSKIEW